MAEEIVANGNLLDIVGAAVVGAVIMFLLMHSRAAGAPAKEAPASSDSGKSKQSAKSKRPAGEFGNFDVPTTMSLIQTRRSIFPKDFDEVTDATRISQESVQLLVEAANWAPCHGKTEPWRFVIVSRETMAGKFAELEDAVWTELLADSPKQLEKRLAKLQKKRKERARCSYTVFICMARVPSKKGSFMPEWEDQAAVACAVQNLHLMATAVGVAGYWSSGGVDSFYQHPKIKEFLGVEQDTKCLGTFVLGSSKKAASYRASRGPISEKVTWL